MELDGEDPETFNLRGVLKHTMEDYDGAIADYTKAIELDDTNPTYFDNRAWSKTEKENYAGAVEDYTVSIELYPERSGNVLSTRTGKTVDEQQLRWLPGFKTSR
jgi:tetratricopeptide (TPR) repeat protein